VTFQKGISGNPGGRRPDDEETKEIKALARQHSKEALEKLVHWLRNGKEKSSVTAAQAILDRGFGKPAQAIEHSGSIGNSHEQDLTEIERLEQLAREAGGEEARTTH
jgi:hypothetical protein